MANHIVILTFDPTSKMLIVQPPHLRLDAGDTIAFACAQGRAQAKLRPQEKFARSEFHAGDAPVAVLADGPFQMPCGVVIGDETFGWPDNEKFGPADQPPDQGGGGGQGGGGNGG